MQSRWRRAVHREQGQVLPPLMLLVVIIVAGGLALVQIGQASQYRAEAATGADAAALAGVRNIEEQILRQVVSHGTFDPHLIDELEIRAAAAQWAQRNDAEVTRVEYEPADLAVRVWVRSANALGERDGGRDRHPDGMGGDLNAELRRTDTTRAAATARAELSITYNFAPPGLSRGGSGPGGSAHTEEELAALSDKAGVPVRADSALRRYGANCAKGKDVRNLTEQMKIAILRAEDAMGRGLTLTSAYRSIPCQAAITNPVGGRKAPPGRSLHNYGMAIDTTMVAELRSAIASRPDIELCQPFPNDDYVHFSWQHGRECSGARGGIGPGGAFGGNPGSFIEFERRLTRW